MQDGFGPRPAVSNLAQIRARTVSIELAPVCPNFRVPPDGACRNTLRRPPIAKRLQIVP